MHYSHKVYEPEKEQQNNLKWNGSFAHYPLVREPISINHRQILKTEVLQQSEHNKTDGGFSGIMKFFNLSDQNDNVISLYRRHLRIDIKKYLKKKFGKPFHLIPTEAFECLRYLHQNKSSELFKTKIFYLYQPYYLMKNIRSLLIKDPDIIKKKDVRKYCYEILNLSLAYGGLDNFLMTTSNVYFTQDMENMNLNYLSFTGLSYILLDDESIEIRKSQFFQTIPYLDSKILQREPQKRINYTVKIRCFLLNVIALIIKEDIELFTDVVKTDVKRVKQDFKKSYFSNFQHQFKKLFSGKNNKKIKKVKQKLNINFLELIDRILYKEEDLSWADVISYVGINGQPENHEQLDKYFLQYHEEMWKKETDKQYYEQRKIHSPELYIPIKFKANLTDILKEKKWWYIFDKDKYEEQYLHFSSQIMASIMQKLLSQPLQNIRVKDVEDYHPIAKIIKECWKENWRDKETSGIDISFYSYHDQWKRMFGYPTN